MVTVHQERTIAAKDSAEQHSAAHSIYGRESRKAKKAMQIHKENILFFHSICQKKAKEKKKRK